MNRASRISAIIIIMVYVVVVFLAEDLMDFVKSANNPKMTALLGFVIFILPILTASVYAVSVWSFWDKLNQDHTRTDYTKSMVNLLVRHQRDGKAKEVIIAHITSDNNRYRTIHERCWVIETLISGDKKNNLWIHVSGLAEICRDAEIENFKKEVSLTIKSKPLTETFIDDRRFIDLINTKAVLCMSYVGGFPTWSYLLEALKPIFEGVTNEYAEEFVLKVDEEYSKPNQFDNSLLRRSKYLDAEGGYRSLILHLRKWLISRNKDTPGKP